MKKLLFPNSFVKLFFDLKDNFTEPSYEHFKVLVSAILLGSPKKTVTAGLRLLKPKGHFSNAHRFLSQYKWDAVLLGLSMITLIIKYLPIEAPFVFAIDDTLVPKYGDKIYGRSLHFDHANKVNRPRYIQGHNWVVVGMLYNCSVFSKWLCFPILADLFIPEKSIPEGHSFKTRIELAVHLMDKINNYLNKKLILVTDGLYAKKLLVQYCIREKINLISRLRSDAALYQKPQKRKIRKRGRPKKYGKKLPKLSQLACEKNKFKSYRLQLYGEMHNLQIRTIEAIWKPAGEVIKVLIVYFDQSKTARYFFSTDLTIHETEMMKIVAARWSIESLFDNFKEHLGMSDWQCHAENSVIRSIPLTSVATSILLVWSYQQAICDKPELWDIYPWYTKKASPSILDMIKQLKSKCISKTILAAFRKTTIDAQKSNQLELFFRMVA